MCWVAMGALRDDVRGRAHLHAEGHQPIRWQVLSVVSVYFYQTGSGFFIDCRPASISLTLTINYLFIQ